MGIYGLLDKVHVAVLIPAGKARLSNSDHGRTKKKLHGPCSKFGPLRLLGRIFCFVAKLLVLKSLMPALYHAKQLQSSRSLVA